MKESDLCVIAVVYGVATWFLVMTLQLPPAAQSYPLILLTALYLCNTLFLGKQLYSFSLFKPDPEGKRYVQEHRENQIGHNHDAGAADNCGDRFYLQEELGQQQIKNAGDVIAQIVH